MMPAAGRREQTSANSARAKEPRRSADLVDLRCPRGSAAFPARAGNYLAGHNTGGQAKG